MVVVKGLDLSDIQPGLDILFPKGRPFVYKGDDY